jgi:phosphoribosyl 1,2-cyclic phosphodiesterase
VKVTVWGTRGSQPTPGPETVRYGGNTSCIELQTQSDTRVVLDAGTGLRRLGVELSPDVRRVDILLTHLHLDHIQGLGFFPPLFRSDFEVHIWGPGSATADLRTRLSRYMSPPLFPVRLPELACDLRLHDLNEGCVEVPGFTVHTALVSHPGPTVGYRLDDGHGSLAYLPDHEPMLACSRFADSPEWCSGLPIAAHVDVLLHDAQYTDDEYKPRVGWGHSTLGHALAFARLASVKHLMPFHHDPGHDDNTLDALFSEAAGTHDENFAFTPAREGETFEVGAAHVSTMASATLSCSSSGVTGAASG